MQYDGMAICISMVSNIHHRVQQNMNTYSPSVVTLTGYHQFRKCYCNDQQARLCHEEEEEEKKENKEEGRWRRRRIRRQRRRRKR